MSHVAHNGLLDGVDSRRSSVASLPHPTGRAISGPSCRDPHPDAAFDRWTSLVEVCASIRPTSLSVLGSPSSPPLPLSDLHPLRDNPPLPLLPGLSSMVRAPLSDIEDDPREAPTNYNNQHNMIAPNPRHRRRHQCELCDKSFDRPSTLKTVSSNTVHAY